LVEHFLGKEEDIPILSGSLAQRSENKISKKNFADVAQLVEHFLGKEEVTGSIPVISSNK
jgi:hypothetical protein